MERIKQNGFENFNKIVSWGYNLEIENPENLKQIREKPDDPCAFYFNHSTMDDPFLVANVIQKESPDRLNNVVIPVSENYAQFKNHPAYALVVRLGRMNGISMPEVVQSYRRRCMEGDSELDGKGDNLNLQFTRLLYKKLGEGSSIIISPEGHRSEEKSLLPTESGVGLMVTMMNKLRHEGKIENGHFIPVAIIFENHKGQMLHYNPREKARVKAIIGEAIDPESVINETKVLRGDLKPSKVSSHILMRHLAELLPVDMQGVYNRDLFKDTLNGRFEQRMDENGKVYVFDKETSSEWK